MFLRDRSRKTSFSRNITQTSLILSHRKNSLASQRLKVRLFTSFQSKSWKILAETMKADDHFLGAVRPILLIFVTLELIISIFENVEQIWHSYTYRCNFYSKQVKVAFYWDRGPPFFSCKTATLEIVENGGPRSPISVLRLTESWVATNPYPYQKIWLFLTLYWPAVFF